MWPMAGSGIRTSTTLFLAQVFSVALLFVTSFILAQNLSPSEYGDFSAAYSCVAIAYVVCLLGADITAFNVISVAHSKNNVKDINAYVAYVFTTVLAMSAALYALGLVAFLVLRNVLEVQASHPVFVAVLFTPAMSMTFFFYKVMTSMSSPVLSNIVYKVVLNAAVLVFVLVMARTARDASARTAVVAYLTPWLLVLVVFVILFRRRTAGAGAGKSPIQLRAWLVPGVSAMPYSIALMALANLGVISAELFAGDEEQVGHYAAATWVSQLFNTLFVSLAFTLHLSRASLCVSEGRPRELRSLINRHLTSMSVIGAGFLLVIVVYGKQILRLYGESYTDAYHALVLLTLMQVIVVLCSLSTPILNYMGHHTMTAAFSVLLIVLIVPASYVLDRLLGVTGIALSLLLAVAITFVTKQILLMIAVRRQIHERSETALAPVR